MSIFADLPKTFSVVASAKIAVCASTLTLSTGSAGSVATLPFA